MREPTSLVKTFEGSEELVTEPKERKKREGEREVLVTQSFRLPDRNWEGIINDYNVANTKKFPFTPLQCKVIIEYVKKGIPPRHIFKTLGIGATRYTNLVNKAKEYEYELEQLSTQKNLNEEEHDKFHALLRNPVRILMADIDRAEGFSELFDWENFNEHARANPEVLMTKMRAKYKDVFSDKHNDGGTTNIQINLGGNWIDEL